MGTPRCYDPDMRWFTSRVGGCWQLLRMWIAARGNLHNPYWTWRMETVFGSDRSKWPPWRDRMGAIIRFGRWVHEMKHHR
jgi:hypothetical protein